MVDRSRLIKYTDAQVIDVYKRTLSSNKTAKELGIGQPTVLRILERNNVPRTGLTAYRANATLFNDEQCKEIAAKYAAGALTADLVAEYGGSFYSVKRAIGRAGVELRLNPAPTVKPGELERAIELHKQGISHAYISVKLGRSQQFVSRILRKAGNFRKHASGESHGHWNGGRTLTGGGYVKVMVSADDPMASMRDGKGYVLEHRLVMARVLGRPLTEKETVHHIDNERANNAPENLQLRHGRHGKHVAMVCLSCGSHNIGFAPIKD